MQPKLLGRVTYPGVTQTDKLLGLFGLAYRARKLDIGEQPVLRALSERRAKLIVIAADAAENTSHRVSVRAGDTPEAVRRMLAMGLDYIPSNRMFAL